MNPVPLRHYCEHCKTIGESHNRVNAIITGKPGPGEEILPMTFPKDFIWGAASSAYQIEGAAHEDGRGPSIWDMFCRKPGAVHQGENGDRTCDHYHRYDEDVSLMQNLGIRAYRFSIAWPRVMPRGKGAVNSAGLDFYDRLTDRLLGAGITPFATLYHWDYPLALYEEGGWLRRDSADWFADYVAAVVSRLSDRIRHWFTFNEPQIFVGMGYQQGIHAPGDRLAFAEVLTIAHNVLLAHGRAVQTIHSCSQTVPRIGYAVAAGEVAVPASDGAEDIRAAREAFFSIASEDCCNATWWLDPPVFGRYPEDGTGLFARSMPTIEGHDMSAICQPLDFLGINVYSGRRYRAGRNGSPEVIAPPPGQLYTASGWPIVPEALYWAPKLFGERYKLPLLVSENGMARNEAVDSDGAVHDPERIHFLRGYLRELKRACAEGIDVRGYFLWSIMDNFEWAAGYSQRFGILYVDYPTGKRIVKDSARWYKEVISENGSVL
jgi:beta-glucosidase